MKANENIKLLRLNFNFVKNVYLLKATIESLKKKFKKIPFWKELGTPVKSVVFLFLFFFFLLIEKVLTDK